MAGLLLFVIDSVACVSRANAWGEETDRLYRAGLNSSGRARFGWEFWPDPCAIWLGLVVSGLVLRTRFASHKLAGGNQAPVTHEVALVYHLFPEETGFVTEQAGLLGEFVPQVAGGLQQLPLPRLDFNAPRIHLKLRPAKDAKPNLATPFFEALHRVVTAPFSFELVAEGGAVYFQIACAPADQSVIEQQLALYFPGVEVEPYTPDLSEWISVSHCRYPRALGGKKTLADFALDPYAPLLALLDTLPETSGLALRVYCLPIPEETMAVALNYAERQAAGGQGFGQQVAQAMKNAAATKMPVAGHFYLGYQEGVAERTQRIQKMLPGVIRELATKLPAWGMVVELAGYFDEEDPFGNAVTQFMTQYETPEHKWLACGDDEEWRRIRQFETSYVDIALPYCVVACDELAALAHFPNAKTQSQRLERAGAPSGVPPALYLESRAEEVHIGTLEVRHQINPVLIPDTLRDRHVYIVGKAGSGKSTLVHNMAVQDIENGHGVAVIDPHGDLIQDLLLRIPEQRLEDVIYFDAAERQQPIALNVMSAEDEDEVSLLADDLLVMLRRLSDTWGERMEHILRHTIYTLLHAPNTTFLDIHRILQNEAFRAEVLKHVRHPLLQDFWTYEYPDLRKDAVQPILNRMSKFLLSPTLAGILGQRDSRLSFTDILENDKIFLANLSKGKIGEDNARLVGSVLVSQMQLAVMRRAKLAKEERAPFMMFVDEFQHFTTSAFEVILSEARKYQLCLTLAHQYISQLEERTRQAIFGNVGTMIFFAISSEDANRVKGQLGQFGPEDVANLDPKAHEAFCRPLTKAADTFKFKTLPPLRAEGPDFTSDIIANTKEQYSSVPGSAAPDAPLDDPASATPALVTPPDAPSAAKQPAPTAPFAGTVKEKILFHVAQAEYLSTAQIIDLCFAHYANHNSKKANASSALKELGAARQLKNQAFGRGNVYFIGRPPNLTAHNLAVRDLYAKLAASGFALASAHFAFAGVPGLVPDLYAVFAAAGGGEIHTAWEYDTGTEGLAELETKLRRYQRYPYDRLVFVVKDAARLAVLRERLQAPRIYFAVLQDFASLSDAAFFSGEAEAPQPFFTA